MDKLAGHLMYESKDSIAPETSEPEVKPHSLFGALKARNSIRN